MKSIRTQRTATPTLLDAIRSALSLLSRRDRRLLLLATAIQMTSSFLDLLGVLLLALVAAVAVSAVQGQSLPSQFGPVGDWLSNLQMPPQNLVILLAACAAVVLLGKSVVSSLLNRRVMIFLANRQAMVTARLSSELLTRPLSFIQRRTTQETSFALLQGAASATVQVLGQFVVAATEIALLALLGVALIVVNPLVTLASAAFFAIVAYLLHLVMGRQANRLGAQSAQAEVESLAAIQQALAVYREIAVSDRRDYFADRIQELRWTAARLSATFGFLGMMPKYIFEVAMVVGGLALGAFLYSTEDALGATATLALYLAASSRIIPSILRLQGAAFVLKGAAGTSQSTFSLARDLAEGPDVPNHSAATGKSIAKQEFADFAGSVSLTNVCYTYPNADAPTISDVSLEVSPGELLVVAGESGAGKSTLIDLLLGVHLPQHGVVTVSGLPPTVASKKWPGKIGYVPQATVLVQGTIRENVALGIPAPEIDDARIWRSLERAQIADYLLSSREGLDTTVGENGLRLSGGQRQRIGIARALYDDPGLLVLDESTSALDEETERDLLDTINSLAGSITVIMITHRSGVIDAAQRVVRLSAGKIVSETNHGADGRLGR